VAVNSVQSPKGYKSFSPRGRGTGRLDQVVNPTVVVAAHSRPRSLQRLLKSLAAAHYPAEGVDIVISIDGGFDPEVLRVADRFAFDQARVRVVRRQENIGLRNHIIWCGALSDDCGAVIVLEDDLIVDPWYFQYAMHAVRYAGNLRGIAGIALYAPEFNEMANLPFSPLRSGQDFYLMQTPCSWGQLWIRNQWQQFSDWYAQNQNLPGRFDSELPAAVLAWPETSWKKYFAAYLVDTGQYFLYPYRSYTTNCASPGGAHVRRGTDTFQVELGWRERSHDSPGRCDQPEECLRYDAFMEIHPDHLRDELELDSQALEIDLHGVKPLSKLRMADYCLTTRVLGEYIAAYPLRFRPIEQNVSRTFRHGGRPDIGLVESSAIRNPRVLGRMTAWYRLRRYYLGRRSRILDTFAFFLLALVDRGLGRLGRFRHDQSD